MRSLGPSEDEADATARSSVLEGSDEEDDAVLSRLEELVEQECSANGAEAAEEQAFEVAEDPLEHGGEDAVQTGHVAAEEVAAPVVEDDGDWTMWEWEVQWQSKELRWQDVVPVVHL
mmetsp:Transcript_81085/g.241607  ORF Transcript_81085/g.241607 Transcript_81085/m.241607 type:complete len:117 (-) Transcript_81085:40-390(-)